MGAGMAARLLATGHRVTVYNRTAARAEPLVASGRDASVARRAKLATASTPWSP